MQNINKEEFKKSIEDYTKVLFRKSVSEASKQQLFQAVSYSVKDLIIDQWMATHREYEDKDIERLSLILTLKNIGLSNETILKYIELNEQGAHTKKQQIQVLKLERQKLLDSIHNQQKNIDSLDYLIYQLKDKEKIKHGEQK